MTDYDGLARGHNRITAFDAAASLCLTIFYFVGIPQGQILKILDCKYCS